MSDIPKGPAAHISQPPPESILHNLHGYCNLLGCKQRQAEWLPVLSLLESMIGLWMDGLGWLGMAWDGLGWLGMACLDVTFGSFATASDQECVCVPSCKGFRNMDCRAPHC